MRKVKITKLLLNDLMNLFEKRPQSLKLIESEKSLKSKFIINVKANSVLFLRYQFIATYFNIVLKNKSHFKITFNLFYLVFSFKII